MTEITTPVAGYTGPGPGGLTFTDGVAHTDDEAVINYCRDAGYGIDGLPPAVDVETPVDPRDLAADGDIVVGTRLRDAAVDPRPEDFLPPTNAGQADPHGPLVVAPEIHASGTQVVRPGQVFVSDLEAQQEAETEQATKFLVEQQDVGEAVETFPADTVDNDGEVEQQADRGPLGLSDPGSVVAVETGNAADTETPTLPDGSTPEVATAEDASPPGGTFDPADSSVAEVNDYLAGADDAERARVLAAETAGKARKGIVEGPNAPAAS